jgi:hypothetical protein
VAVVAALVVPVAVVAALVVPVAVVAALIVSYLPHFCILFICC